MWHSLEENGNIEVYDVMWPDGSIEQDIPVDLLESVKEGSHHKNEQHGVQPKDTPKSKRKYKNK